MNDLLLIGIGIGGTLAILFAFWTQRDKLKALREGAAQRIEKTRSELSSNMDERYRSAVIEMVNSMHIASHLIPLEKVAVRPRFFLLPEPFDISEADDPNISIDPMDFVPIVPEYPEIIARYNRETVKIDELLLTEDNVLLLGHPGSGRTVTLGLVALLIARRKISMTMNSNADDDDIIPLYLHLRDLPLDNLETVSDPMLPLFEAGRAKLKFLAGQALSAIQGEFIGERGVLLIDGLDEIPAERLGDIFAWLTSLAELYPGNKIVVAGAPTGYGPLLKHNFVPVFVQPWQEDQSTELAKAWAEAWPEIASDEKEPAPEPEAAVIRDIPLRTAGLSPLDVTLKAWGMLANDVDPSDRITWYDGYINRVTGIPAYRPALEQLAAELYLDEYRATRPLREASTIFDNIFKNAEEKPPVVVSDFIFTIAHETNLLIELPGSDLIFKHPVMQAYLAAYHFAREDFIEDLVERTVANTLVMPFLAAIHDMTPYVAYNLQQSRTLSRDEILHMGPWLRDAPPGMLPWRTKVLQAFEAILTAPQTYPAIRERACAALAASLNPRAETAFIAGMESGNHDAIVLSCLGLGAVRSIEGIPALGDALANPNAGIEAAAALGAGAIGDTNSVNLTIETLVAGSSLARRAAAEMFALNQSGEGHDILREALEEEDPEIRRAAVFGLRKLGRTQWAVKLVDERRKRDDEWLVRAAADNAWADMTAKHGRLPTHPQQANEIVWVQAGYEDKLIGEKGYQALVHFLEKGNEAEQLAITDLFGSQGEARAIEPLYNKLGNEHAELRDAAHRALLSVGRAANVPLPTP